MKNENNFLKITLDRTFNILNFQYFSLLCEYKHIILQMHYKAIIVMEVFFRN